MKRLSIVCLLIAALIVSSMLFVACDGNISTEVLLSSYEFTGIDATYDIGEEFSIEGAEIVLKFSDNSTQRVTITADMVKELPDMSTTGEKTIKIEYNGKEYTFKITVGYNADKTALVEKIAAFWENYEGLGAGTELSWGYDFNLIAAFFGQTENVEFGDEYDIENPLKLPVYYYNNPMLSQMLIGYLDLIVSGSFKDKGYFDIISGSDLQASIDYLQVFAELYEYINDNKSNIADAYANEFGMITGILDYTGIEAVSGVFEELISNILQENEIDYLSVVIDINEIYQDYSVVDQEQKILIDKFVLALQDDDKAHMFSNFIFSFKDVIKVYDSEGNVIETQAARELAESYVEALTDVIKELEEIERTGDFEMTIENITELSYTILDIEEDLAENDWYIFTSLPVNPGKFLKIFLEKYQDNEYQLVDTLRELEVFEMIFVELFSETFVSVDTIKILSDFLYNLIDGEEIDYFEYLTELGLSLDFDGADISTFLANMICVQLGYEPDSDEYDDIYELIVGILSDFGGEGSDNEYLQYFENLFDLQPEDVFDFSGVYVEYILDDEGDIIGEMLKITLSVDFDIMVASLSGEFDLYFKLMF